MCEQNRTGSKDRDLEQDDGFGCWLWGVPEVKEVAVGSEATNDVGAWGSVEGVALVGDRDFAVIADANAGLLAPDVRPPRALGGGADDRAFLGEGLSLGGVGRLAQFAMDFMPVGVGDELIQQLIGPSQFDDALGGQEGDEAFLPVVVAPFDFAFGLGRGGVAQFDAVEVEGLAQLGEGLGVVGVEKGVEIYVEGQGQAVGLEDAGKEVEVGQERFGRIESCARVEAGGVVENIQQDLLFGAARQPGVGCGVVLPERAVIPDLPAFDGFGLDLVARVGGQLVCEGPTTDAGAVGFEVQAAVEFAGDAAVGARRFGREEFGDQGGDFGGPSGVMIAPGTARSPSVGVPHRGGAEVIGVEFVEPGTSQSQCLGGRTGTDLTGAKVVEQMPDDRCREAFDPLGFFIGPNDQKAGGFFAWELETAGACRAGEPARPAVCKASDDAQVASPQSPILR